MIYNHPSEEKKNIQKIFEVQHFSVKVPKMKKYIPDQKYITT